MTDPTQPPPGEPVAETMAEQFADIVVVDGPFAGRIYTFDAAHGGYLPADPKVRMENDRPQMDIGAVLDTCRAQVVRPVEEGS
jgi:hypothetical protein